MEADCTVAVYGGGLQSFRVTRNRQRSGGCSNYKFVGP